MTEQVSLRQTAAVLLDQAISSGTNFTGLVLIARSVPAADFGDIAAAVLVILLVLGGSRAAIVEPMLVRAAVSNSDASGTVASAFSVGLALAVAGAGTSLIVFGLHISIWLIASLMLPGLLVQDALRYCHFQQGVPLRAVRSDALWMAISISAILGASALDLSSAWMLGGWGLGGSVAGLADQRLSHYRIGLMARWLSTLVSHWRLSAAYLVDYFSTTFPKHSALIVFSFVEGARTFEFAGYRGAEVLFGPLVVLHSAVYPIVLPRAVAARHDRSVLRRLVVGTSAASVSAALTLTLLVTLLPDRTGAGLLGDTWVFSKPLLGYVGLTFVASGVTAGFVIGLRAMEAQWQLARLRTLFAIPTFVAPVGGALIWSGRGFALGASLVSICFGLSVLWAWTKRLSDEGWSAYASS